jgi:predicted DNA-binding transcriptional regulator YafY
MEAATVLELPSERPADFDLAAAWRESMDRLRRERTRFATTLRLEPSAAASLTSWEMTAPVEKDGGSDAEPPGWVTLRVHFHDEEHARFVVLGLGSRAIVLTPEDLREKVAAELSAALERVYSSKTAASDTSSPGSSGLASTSPSRSDSSIARS